MLTITNSTSHKLHPQAISLLRKIKKSLCKNAVELVIVKKDEIWRLNREFLGRDYPTDVLSFGLDYSGILLENPPLGSVVISIDSALESCEKFKHSLSDEMAILFTHALLHLLGYDHERDNGEHRAKEREILARFGIDSTLISRTLGDGK